MGENTTQHICALGGFSDNGTGVLVEESASGEDRMLQGRYVYMAFKVTTQLLDFIKTDVLVHIKVASKYTHAVRVGDHRLFLVHGIVANEDPEVAWKAFINTFKQMLSELQFGNPELFQEIRYGHVPTPVRSETTVSLPPRYLDALAVNSSAGMHGSKRDE